MTDSYMRDLLRIAIAQICQTIGYNATQTTPQELLEDVLHKFLQEFCRDLRRQTEHYNRTEVNLTDVLLTLKSLRVSANELLDYVNNVEPVAFPYPVPKFPRRTETNLNFLRPGCKEYLTRPVHIDSHYPPMVPSSPPQNLSHQSANGEGDQSSATSSDAANLGSNNHGHNAIVPIKNTIEEDLNPPLSIPVQDWHSVGLNYGHQGCVPREVKSVMMTSSGFISPAVEGLLPSAKPPDVLEKLKGIDSHGQVAFGTDSTGASAADGDKTKATKGGANQLDRDRDSGSGATAAAAGPKSHSKLNESRNDSHLGKEKTGRPSSLYNSGGGSGNNKKNMVNHNHQHPSFAGGQGSSSASVVSKLLKKARKKNNTLLLSPGKAQQQPHVNNAAPTIPNAQATGGAAPLDPGTEKIQRKCIKILHKLAKTKDLAAVKELFGSDGKFKGVLGPALLGALPPGTERQQLEKLFRKMAKHKQKLLKQQMGREGKTGGKRGGEAQLFAPDGTVITGANKKSMAPPPAPSSSAAAGPGAGTTTQPSQQSGSASASTTGTITLPDESAGEMVGKDFKAKRALPVSPTKGAAAGIVGANSGGIATDANQSGQAESGADSFNKSDAPDAETSKTNLEITKLSTEPSRSKLNIFKKITKQKKSPNLSKLPVSSTTIFEDVEGAPVINLPSGTTITPAPPTNAGQHVYSPDVQADEVQGGAALNGANVSVFSTDSNNPNDPALINKPKKRGRKPGQKNHPKTPAQLEAASNLKKSKKMKLQPPINIPSEVTVEPLNLTSADQQPPFDAIRYDMMPNFGTGGIPKPMLLGESLLFPVQTKEKKERKKRKNMQGTAPLPAGDLNSSKDAAPILGPTKEEVSLINEKLLRMDTVMKTSTVPGVANSDSKKPLNEPSTPRSMTSSPSKSMSSLSPSPSSSKSPGSKKSKSQSKMPLGPRMGTMPSPFMPPAGLGNLQNNMLPMMQLYPFPPRPGLIPTPGLFPTPGFTNFPNPANPSSMLLGGFLPFPNLKPVTSTAAANQEKSEEKLPPLPPMGDRSYCNVAPLVPESMKLMPPDPTSSSAESLPSPKTKRDERDTPKPSKSSKHQTSFADPQKQDSKRASLEGKSKLTGNPDTEHLPVESFGEKGTSFGGSNPFGSAAVSANPTAPVTAAVAAAATTKPIGMAAKANANLGTMDAPIEVSDDSVDAPPTIEESTEDTSPSKFKSKQTSFFSPGSDEGALFGKVKKLKKHTGKISKKHGGASDSSPPGHVPPMENFVLEKFSKLAGGADLITLPPGGQIHSAKGPPFGVGGASGSLITASVTPSFTISKKEVDKPSGNFFDNITITSSSGGAVGSGSGGLEAELQKRRKEHKKLKKTKEGKIKKKKDKKDKTKSKERGEKHLLKAEKILKDRDMELYPEVDFIKKLKKEKKREKQNRLAMEVMARGDKSAIKATTYSSGGSLADAGAHEKPHHTVTASADSTVNFASSNNIPVPKLTLKLGDRDKKELSPELARISPLVTRPPKLSKSTVPTGGENVATLSPMTSTSTSSFPASSISHRHAEATSEGKLSAAVSATSSASAGGNVIGTAGVNITAPPNPWYDGGTISASSVLLPQQLLQASKMKETTTSTSIASALSAPMGGGATVAIGAATTSAASSGSGSVGNAGVNAAGTVNAAAATHTDERSSSSSTSTSRAAAGDKQTATALVPEANRPSSYIDAEGNRVWICPACGKVDDGSAMIGCDGCDAWYHWVCVGIFIAPKDNEDWFCRVCITKRKGAPGSDKKRKRTKKK